VRETQPFFYVSSCVGICPAFPTPCFRTSRHQPATASWAAKTRLRPRPNGETDEDCEWPHWPFLFFLVSPRHPRLPPSHGCKALCSRLTAVPFQPPCIRLNTTPCLLCTSFHLASTRPKFPFSFFSLLFFLFLGSRSSLPLLARPQAALHFVSSALHKHFDRAAASAAARGTSTHRVREVPFPFFPANPTINRNGLQAPRLVTHPHPTPSPALTPRNTVKSFGLSVHLAIILAYFTSLHPCHCCCSVAPFRI
jgi:hypothetical protein